MKQLRKTSEHGPIVAVREDQTPYNAYIKQEALLDQLRRRRDEIARLEAEIDQLISLGRMARISWRRLGNACGIPWKTVYDRRQQGERACG